MLIIKRTMILKMEGVTTVNQKKVWQCSHSPQAVEI